MAKKKFLCIYPVKFNGTTYPAGSDLELDDKKDAATIKQLTSGPHPVITDKPKAEQKKPADDDDGKGDEGKAD